MQAIEFIHPMERDRLCECGCTPSPLTEARLVQIAMELRSARTVSEVFDELVEHLRDDLPFDRLGLALLSADGSMVVSRRVYSAQPTLLWGPGEQAALLGSSLEALLREGAIRIIHDLRHYQQLRPSSEPTRRLIQEGMRSSLTLPLYDGETPLGFLFVTSCEPGTYMPRHVAIASVLAPTIGRAFARAMAHELDAPVTSLPAAPTAERLSDQRPAPW